MAIPAGTLTQQLQWRYATKKFDAGKRIDPITWAALEGALVLAPSAFGLQPWKFLVITDPALKARLRPVSWNQSQIEDCSHLVVFLARKGLGLPEIERFVDRMAEVRGVPRESLEPYRGFMIDKLVEGPGAKGIGRPSGLHRPRRLHDGGRHARRGRLPHGGAGSGPLRRDPGTQGRPLDDHLRLPRRLPRPR